MPVHVIMTTPQEMFEGMCTVARSLSDDIVRLSDLTKTPLNPGEGPDARRHQIAKLGKQLAEAFIAIDDLVRHAGQHGHHHHDVTAGPPDKGGDPNAN